jgi:DNA primase
MILVMVSHPALLERHLEDFDALDLEDPELARLKSDIVDAVLLNGAKHLHEIVDAVRKRGRLALLERLQVSAGARGEWSVAPGAAEVDAETSWLQMVALHRRARTLHRDLKAAETAFGLDPSEENDARLRAIRRELLATEGTEALVEGYGVQSGRQPRTS